MLEIRITEPHFHTAIVNISSAHYCRTSFPGDTVLHRVCMQVKRKDFSLGNKLV